MKYMRNVEQKGIFDIYKIMDRAFSFSEQQIKLGNFYVAIVIQASLLEETVRELIFIKAHLMMNPEIEGSIERENKLVEEIQENSFYRNINIAHEHKCINLTIKKDLHKYRKGRNALFHEAFYSTITKKDANQLFRLGNKLLKELASRISNLNDRMFRDF